MNPQARRLALRAHTSGSTADVSERAADRMPSTLDTRQFGAPTRLEDASSYPYGPESTLGHHHAYLLPAVRKILRAERRGRERRLFELGCGNGSVAAELTRDGFDVCGVDPSEQGIDAAKRANPHLRLEVGSAYDDLPSAYGRFPFVLSLEVIEHVYAPRAFANTVRSLLEPGGVAIISTPYHGYSKNLALAIAGQMDAHFTALWDHGHIKFWSVKTLTMLLREAGFGNIRFVRVGRLPILAKSMIAIARTEPYN